MLQSKHRPILYEHTHKKKSPLNIFFFIFVSLEGCTGLEQHEIIVYSYWVTYPFKTN